MHHILSELKDRMYELAKKTPDKIGISFSGGLDSSLLAKICKDLNKDVILLTVAFPDSSDIKYAKKIADEMKIPLLIKELSINELENDLKKICSIVNFDRLIEIEISLLFYYIFKFARENGIDTVLTANSLDAQFCGFDKFKREFEKGEIALKEKIKSEFDHALQTEKEYKKIAEHFGVKMISPFLNNDFFNFTINLPLESKIKSSNDDVRKHVLRELSSEIGVPAIAIGRSKKSMQYSSRLDNAIEKLARKYITKDKAKYDGYVGVKEAYLKNILHKN